MRRIALIALGLIVVAIAVAVIRGPSSASSKGPYLVRAVFDDASFAARGEDVRIAGANVGSIQTLGVTSGKKAAVTIAITDNRFAPFHDDATCAIRPQSLIGEEYVDCTPGTASAARLPRIDSGPGTGTYYLPVTRTSSPIDSDIVQNISTQPVRQSLALIINEFGTGLAARGSDLNAVIHRANPALGNTDKVLKILAGQNKTLAQLATDSNTVLGPLARERRRISGFITQANTTAVASATRAQAISQTFRKFPGYLAQLRPLMTSLGHSASALGQQFANLTPFAKQARSALINLGAAAHTSQPSLLATQPLANRLRSLGDAGAPTASNLQKLLTSVDSTGGIEQLMRLLFNGAIAGNGFNSLSHYVRDEALTSSCTNYATSAVPGCASTFAAANAANAASASASDAKRQASHPDRVVARAVQSASQQSGTTGSMSGLLSFLMGKGQ